MASISTWVLFILGWVTLLGSMWGYLSSGPIGSTPAFDFVGLWALAAACFILSVVAAKLNQMQES